MHILIIGSGGREHALAWKLAQSPRAERISVAPGNAGTAEVATNVALDGTDHAAVLEFCRLNGVGLVVVGPEGPLVAGLADDLRAGGVPVFGPSKAAAQLEGSKAFTKALCDEAGIPTAAYGRFDDEVKALAYLQEVGAPIVVKADGLAAGKGVTVAMTQDEAEAAVHEAFGGRFGAAGAEVVIEAYLEGEEASVFAVCDGTRAILLPAAQDHKRVGDGDTGPNTGGMGAYSPAPVMDEAMMARVEAEIVQPALAAMARRGTPFTGVLFAGIMVTATGPELIEFNVRFGDPECQVLMLRLASDLLDLIEGAARGDLSGVAPRWHAEPALTVVVAAKGYPGDHAKGGEIGGLAGLGGPDAQVFHAGTARREGRLVSTGGRVLTVTVRGRDVAEAQRRAYQMVDAIDFPDGFCRRDIGWRAVNRA